MRKVLIGIFTILSITAANADTMALSRMDDATEKYIQQGWSERVASCALDEIEFAKSIKNSKNVVITFNESETDIKFYFKNTKFTRICGLEYMTELSPGKKPLRIPY